MHCSTLQYVNVIKALWMSYIQTLCIANHDAMPHRSLLFFRCNCYLYLCYCFSAAADVGIFLSVFLAIRWGKTPTPKNRLSFALWLVDFCFASRTFLFHRFRDVLWHSAEDASKILSIFSNLLCWCLHCCYGRTPLRCLSCWLFQSVFRLVSVLV